MKLHSRSIYGCTQAPEEFEAPDNCLLTYHPESRRIYIHVLQWPMGRLYLKGYAGKVKYAQLLGDASELKFAGQQGAWMAEERGIPGRTLILRLPVQKPDVTIPVIELFLN